MSLTEQRLCKCHLLMCSAGHIIDSDHVFPELNNLSEWNSSYLDLGSNATSKEVLPGHLTWTETPCHPQFHYPALHLVLEVALTL